MIYLGTDHRGFELKERLKKRLIDDGLEVTDLGNDHFDPDDDYVDFAEKVGGAVLENPGSFGVLLCGSGVGVDMVSNKIPGIRSSLVQDVIRAKQSRAHEDANVVSLPSDILDEQSAYDITRAFIDTPFSDEERHNRRLNKMKQLETQK